VCTVVVQKCYLVDERMQKKISFVKMRSSFRERVDMENCIKGDTIVDLWI
jgi:hypothetical protein